MAQSLADLWRPRLGDFEQWLVVAVAGVIAAAALAGTDGDLALARGLVFVGGPLLWLCGMAPRLAGYLHDPARARLLPLPLPARVHWRAAGPAHHVGALTTMLVGTLAIAGGSVGRLSAPQVAGLVGDWLWLSLAVVLVEPWAPAAAAWLGRRFTQDTTARRAQVSLSGGWTLPEASAHLYLPPLCLGVATAIAMPGQLWLDGTIDGRVWPSGLAVAALAGPIAAVLLRPLPRRLYGRGVFEAVPWLTQATRTLAGPPIPSPLPGWVERLRRPDVRLFAMQLWRMTPVPGLRLWTMWIVAAWVGVLAGPTLARVTVVAALAVAWLVPAIRVWTRLAPGRGAALRAPIGGQARPPAAIAIVLVPIAVAAGLVGFGYVNG